jgi:3-oxo-4-pregnene-20-carboxyl-CoA dehydrogenase alpha subunit
VDFTLDETQRSIAELARTVLRGASDHARTEQALATAPGYDETLWKGLAQAGLLSLAVPASHGGDGYGAVEVSTVLAEVGRQTLPVPALATLAMGVLPLAALGGADVLREIADGGVLSAALTPMSLARGTISGRATGVPYAAQALRIVVPCAEGLALVRPGDTSLTRTPTSSGTPEYTVVCDAAPAEVVRGDPAVLDRYAVAGAVAVADGVLAGALNLTAEHVRTRHQFGKPLATFQAVAQQIADVYVTARTVHLASCAVNYGLADDDVDVAAYWVASELPTAVQICHHLHGGLGVDNIYPLHRYYAHAKDLGRLVGGASSRLDRIGARCSSN